MSLNHPANTRCIFCYIASSYEPTDISGCPIPSSSTPSSSTASNPTAPAHVLVSTAHILSFLDIMPLSLGHTLVIPRKHLTKISDLDPLTSKEDEEIAKELGYWIPVISRAVMRAVNEEKDEKVDDADGTKREEGEVAEGTAGDFNIVGNMGPTAGQVVPHVHYHIIPRPPLNSSNTSSSASLTIDHERAWIMIGGGQRQELDHEEGEELARRIKAELTKMLRGAETRDDGEGVKGRL